MSPKTSRPFVSVVILNWNRKDDTLACIKSVKKLRYENFETLIVDNGSVDGSKEVLRNTKGIRLVDNATNRGFTGGHVDGLRESAGEYILLLNNDALISPDFLDIAIDEMLGDETIGAIGGRAYTWDSESKPYDTSNPYYAFQNINPITAEGIFERTDTGIVQVANNVSGSAVLVRKTVIDKVGYLYEPYFAYYEETDLFARMKRAGYKVLYDPRLHIWHKSGASSSSYFQFNQMYKNRFLFAVRNFEPSYLPAFVASYVKTGVAFTIRRLLPSEQPELYRGFSNAFLRTLVTWPSALISRMSLSRSLGKDSLGYNTIIIKERLGISYVVDATKLSKEKCVALVEQLFELSKKQAGNLDFVLLTAQHITPLQNVNTVRVTKQYDGHRLNIGWMSAKYDFVEFLEGTKSPVDIDKSFNEVVAMQKKGLWLTSAKNPISKELLVKHGGFEAGETVSESFNRLRLYTWSLDKKRLPKTLRKQKYPMDTRLAEEASRGLFDRAGYGSRGKLEGFLGRHYRLYQVRNLVAWLFSPRIGWRTKVSRVRKTLLAGMTLNRSQLAAELRSMHGELIGSYAAGIGVDRNEKIMSELNHALKKNNYKDIPIFIICRDRINSLRLLIRWLEGAGYRNIIFIDNDSKYPPLVTFLRSSPYQVIHTQNNVGHTVPWALGIVKTLYFEAPYVITDPDVIPSEEAPNDLLRYLLELHKKYFYHQKIGLGLRIDDLPDHYKLKESVITWENQFWKNELEPNVYESAVDTTFALYKPFNHTYFIHTSLRTGFPYVARHMPWYVDSTKLDDEEKFYRMRASGNVTTWNSDELDDRYNKEISKLK